MLAFQEIQSFIQARSDSADVLPGQWSAIDVGKTY